MVIVIRRPETMNAPAGARTYHDHNWGTWGGVTWDWGQEQAGGYSVLYGGVSGGDPDRTATGPRILHLTDEHADVTGFRAGAQVHGNPSHAIFVALLIQADGRTETAMKVATKRTNGEATTGYEAELWAMADALRASKPEARQPKVPGSTRRPERTLRRWGSGAEKA